MQENLIRTPSIDEAVAYLEAFLFGNENMTFYITGAVGVGKSFLAEWARAQTRNGKRGAIYDNQLPDPASPFWVCFLPTAPEHVPEDQIVTITEPEYERKRGVLTEWASVRNLSWQAKALDALLGVDTWNLQLLRSLAQRTGRGINISHDQRY